VYFGFPPVPYINTRDAAKLLYPGWETNPVLAAWMQQSVTNALSDWGESPEMQMIGLYERIRLARIWNGLPDRTDQQNYVWPDNNTSPTAQVVWLNNWLPYGNPPQTLPSLLDELRERLLSKIANPPAPQPE
jgi:hypothetical protein